MEILITLIAGLLGGLFTTVEKSILSRTGTYRERQRLSHDMRPERRRDNDL